MRKVDIEITTFKDYSIGAKHYYVDIREENTEDERGQRFSCSDFKYLPHAKKWAEMIVSEYFPERSHEVTWEEGTDDLENYKLATPGRF